MPYCVKHKKFISEKRWARHMRKHAEEYVKLEDKKLVEDIVKEAIQKTLNTAAPIPYIGLNSVNENVS